MDVVNRSSLIGQFVLLAAGALLMESGPIFAQDALPQPRARMAGSSEHFDWVQHTQRTLDDLKGKLNLAPEQLAAWDTWSGGVIKDARQQLDQKYSGREPRARSMADGTTPARMAQAIERLRAETNRMQAHLVQLEAAQVRTQAFYNALSPNQKTIFDLFWHEVYHRASAQDHGREMYGHEGSGAINGQR